MKKLNLLDQVSKRHHGLRSYVIKLCYVMKMKPLTGYKTI